jgi:HK97 gp10 family phage protein
MAIEIKGLDSLMRKLSTMGGNVLDALEKSVKQTAVIAQGDARTNAPVDTGALKGSISTEHERKSDSATSKVYTNVEYGLYQELGTINMAAHPFMLPAAKANESTFERLAKSELQSAILKTAGGG